MKNKIIITPEFWGPFLWNFLHYLSKNVEINKENKRQIYLFLISLSFILPCKNCVEHYKTYIYHENKLIEEEINKKYLTNWMCDLHNSVNMKLGKKIFTLKECKSKNNKLFNIKFFIFINIFIIHYSKKDLSIYHFNQIKQFFISLSYIYPNKNIKNNFKKIIDKNFYKLSNMKELKSWYVEIKNKFYNV